MHTVYQWIAIMLAALSLAGLEVLTVACAPAERQAGAQTVAHALTFDADVCESIARSRGRADLALLCRETYDGAVVLDKATEPVVCDVPRDAGAGEAGPEAQQ